MGESREWCYKSLQKKIFVKCYGEIRKDKDFEVSIGFPVLEGKKGKHICSVIMVMVDHGAVLGRGNVRGVTEP